MFSIGYRGFRHLDTLLDGSNDFDETLIEYGPGLHLPGGDGELPPENPIGKSTAEKRSFHVEAHMFFGAQFQLNFSQNPLLRFTSFFTIAKFRPLPIPRTLPLPPKKCVARTLSPQSPPAAHNQIFSVYQ